MPYFAMRFDLRNPDFAGVSTTERYAAALDMVEWADELGFVMVMLSEHHASEDGYLPSPLTMAAAVAARTKRVRIQIAALIAPFYDPIRLAEDIAVVDNISGGRLEVVVANGYVAGEFEMFGKDGSQRVHDTVETIETLRAAWRGEPFPFRDRTVRVLPRPAQQPGPPILLGGSVEAAARRAAHIADGFVPSVTGIFDDFRDELRQLGKPDPGPRDIGDTSSCFFAKDPEAAWEQLGPFAMHEMNAYGAWLTGAGLTASTGYQPVTDLDQVVATGQYRVYTPDEYIEKIRAAGPFAFGVFHPMAGGFPPELAWESLRLFESEVLPHLEQA